MPTLTHGQWQAKAGRRISNAAPFLPGIAWTVAAARQPEAGEVERRNLVDRLGPVQWGDPRISVVQKVRQAQLVVRLDSQIQPHIVDVMAIAVVRQRGLVVGKAIESLIVPSLMAQFSLRLSVPATVPHEPLDWQGDAYFVRLFRELPGTRKP